MKRIVSIILMFMLLIGCVACSDQSQSTTEQNTTQGGQTTANTATDKVTEVKMWTFLNPNGGTSSREVALAEIIKNFETANKNIKIVTETIAFDQIPAKYFAAHVAGNGPDIIWMSFLEMGEAVRLGTMADLNTLFINNWSDAEKKDMTDVFWNFAADDKNRYQLTFVRSADMLVYRTDLFKAKGYEAPFKSWDKFIEACKAVTEDTNGDGNIDVYGFGQQFGSEKTISNIFIPSLVELQGGMFDESGTPNWASEAGVKSMQLATDMVTKDGITPAASVSYSQEDLIEGFCAGKYACITAAASRLPSIRKTVTFDPMSVKLAHFPSWSGNTFGSGVLSGWCVGVWAKSQKQEAAAKFVEAMFNPDSEKIWVETGLQVPFRKSTYDNMSDYFKKPENDYMVAQVEEFMDYGWTRPWKYVISGYNTLQNEAAQRILLDGMSVKESLDQSIEEFNKQNK